MSNGIRVTDAEYGKALLANLTSAEGTFKTSHGGHDFIVEAFDEPFIALQIERNGPDWTIILPYNHSESFQPSSLRLDDWDRFHGRTLRGVPFVLSRPAQAEFFRLVDEFDDDSVVIDGKSHPTPFWLGENPAVSSHAHWTDVFEKEASPGWDLGGPSPVLVQTLPQLKLPRSRVLVLGAGAGHDAAHFAEQGHLVTAVDFSPAAQQRTKEKYGHLRNLEFVLSDVFKLPDSFTRSFDLIFEHTCYCAIEPKRRSELVSVWTKCLADAGHLLGIFFAMDKPEGPPFGGSEWEVRERLKKHFRFLYWTRARNSLPRRLGRELVVYAQKANQF